MHTPGPWFVSDDTIGHIKSRSGLKGNTPTIVQYRGLSPDPMATDRIYYDFTTITPEEQEANAHLIAAAPEMLEALEAISEYLNGADLVYHRGSKDSQGNRGQKFVAAQFLADKGNDLIRKAKGK